MTTYAVNGLPIPKGWEATKWSEPPTGDLLLRVMRRSGWISHEPAMAKDLEWEDRGLDRDIVAVGKWDDSTHLRCNEAIDWMIKKRGKDFRMGQGG